LADDVGEVQAHVHLDDKGGECVANVTAAAAAAAVAAAVVVGGRIWFNGGSVSALEARENTSATPPGDAAALEAR
jgi:negative regulator of sigma E activity